MIRDSRQGFEFSWMNSLGLMKSNVCVSLLNILHKIYSKATIYVSELILKPFSPFDIKCKKLNVKNFWKCIFMVSGRLSFSYFPKIALDHWGAPRHPNAPWISMGPITIFRSSPMQRLKWSSLWQKIKNSWKLLLTVLTESFVLHVTGLLDPSL